MKELSAPLFLLFTLFMVMGPCLAADSLFVIHSTRDIYSGDSGEEATVDHYLLSDSSLFFVKLFLSDSPAYTLPQTVSGSGVRYSDGMDMTWWETGESAIMQQRDSLGNWETKITFILTEQLTE